MLITEILKDLDLSNMPTLTKFGVDIHKGTFDSNGGNIRISKATFMKVNKHLTNKKYPLLTDKVRCYTFNNIKLYVDSRGAKRSIKYYPLGSKFYPSCLVVVEGENVVNPDTFPVVDKYYDIEDYDEYKYCINNEISIMLRKKIGSEEYSMRVHVNSVCSNLISRLEKDGRFKYINDVLEIEA
jgi:hypothetical protein